MPKNPVEIIKKIDFKKTDWLQIMILLMLILYFAFVILKFHEVI